MRDHDSNATDPLDPADPVNRDSVADSWGRAAAYDAYADGLHTYALGGLRHHEAAASAVYCAFVAADHHVAHLGDAEMLRPWLYAITRHYCRAGQLPRLRLTAASAPPSSAPFPAPNAAMAELERSLLAAELASLDWPDTDGLSAPHREVLELSVRHGMESRAVGLILGKPAAESFEVLSQAWHELERSLAAQALLRTTRSHCPDLASLAHGWSGRLTAQRREPLVAHIDTCSRCQYHLHKVIGAPQAPTILPHVAAPKELRERVLGDLLDSSAEKAAGKAAIAARLAYFDEFGFPAMAPARQPSEPPHPRTGTLLPEQRRPRRLGGLLAGRQASAADAKTPANTTDEGSGLDAAALNAASERRSWLRRASVELEEGPIAPRSSTAAGEDAGAGSGFALERDRAAERKGALERGGEAVPGAGVLAGSGAERGAGLSAGLSVAAFGAEAGRSGAGGGRAADFGGEYGARLSADAFGAEPGRSGAGGARAEHLIGGLATPATAAAQSAEVLAALRSVDFSAHLSDELDASFGPAREKDSSCGDTHIASRRGVFDDVGPVRSVPAPGPVPRTSVAAAVAGRRRGVEDVRRGVVPVGDAYEAAATVAAAVAAGDAAGAQEPPIAPVGVVPTSVMPVGVVPGKQAPRALSRSIGAPADARRQKSGVKSALASSAVLSGVGAAGVTAFVLFVPSAPGGTKTLFTPPDAGGHGAQTPDYQRPGSSAHAGPALPVAGSVHSPRLPGNDSVTAQVVAAVLSTTPSSSTPSPTSNLPVNGPIDPLPSQSDTAPSSDPSADGQLHISVSQRSNNPADVDVILWNSGTSPVSWTARTDASWIGLSATSGMLAGGAQTVVHVLVDDSAEPNGPWTAHVRFDPSGEMISISGVGGHGGTPSGTPSSSPTSPPSSSPTSTPSTPTPTPSSTPSGTPTTPVSTPSTPPHSSASSSAATGGASSGGASGPGTPGSPNPASSPGSAPSSSGSGSPSKGTISPGD